MLSFRCSLFVHFLFSLQTLENTVTVASDSQFSGNVVAKFKNAKKVEVEASASTSGKVSVEAKYPYEGATLIVKYVILSFSSCPLLGFFCCLS
jgi:hypothetical protein